MKHKKLSMCFLVISLLTMSLIFFFSSEGSGESNGRSKGIVEKVGKVIPEPAKIFASENIKDVTYETSANYLIRKAAHYSIYSLLGIFVFLTFYTYQQKKRYCFLYSSLICFLYACSDEYHQSFTGRTASFSDVVLDTTGAIIACLLLTLILHVWIERKKDVRLSL